MFITFKPRPLQNDSIYRFLESFHYLTKSSGGSGPPPYEQDEPKKDLGHAGQPPPPAQNPGMDCFIIDTLSLHVTNLTQIPLGVT